MINKKLPIAVFIPLVLAGCATQPPAPVVQGYWKATKADTRQALRQSPSVVEELENY